jgi:hypothetical protein
MSTVDSTEYLNSHSRAHSHSRSSHRLARPFTLPRIPSERFDPRSINYDQTSGGHGSGQKRGEHNVTNGASFAANGSISAPSIHPNGQLKRISKRAEVATHSHQPEGTSHPRLDRLPHFDADADGKAEISATNMQSKSRWVSRNLQDALNMLTMTQVLTATYKNRLLGLFCLFRTSFGLTSGRTTPNHSSQPNGMFLCTLRPASFSTTLSSV